MWKNTDTASTSCECNLFEVVDPIILLVKFELAVISFIVIN
jgi:hypothetical protein